MNANESKIQASGRTLPEPARSNHRKVIEDLLEVVRKQQDIMQHLARDLEFTRHQSEENLKYDNGGGCYLADVGEQTKDYRAEGMDVGNGVISTDTATDYLGYKLAMDNFEAGFKKTKEQVEKSWSAVDVVQESDGGGFVQKGSSTLPRWLADSLEKGRKAAAQE